MKKCHSVDQQYRGRGGVVLRMALQRSQSENHNDSDSFGGSGDGLMENADFHSCMLLPYDEEIAEMKRSVEKILGEVKSEYHEPLALETDLRSFEEPLLRLRTFLENNQDPPNSSAPAVNGPCKDPIQALRAFLDR